MKRRPDNSGKALDRFDIAGRDCVRRSWIGRTSGDGGETFGRADGEVGTSADIWRGWRPSVARTARSETCANIEHWRGWRPSVARTARSETCAEHWRGWRPSVARTANIGEAGDLRSRGRRGRRPAPNMNIGGKYFGKSVPELVDRYAHFDGLSPVITGFLILRLTCNRFYFVNLADQ